LAAFCAHVHDAVGFEIVQYGVDPKGFWHIFDFFAAANYDDLVPAILFGHCRETSQAIRDHKLDHYNAEILHTRFLSKYCFVK